MPQGKPALARASQARHQRGGGSERNERDGTAVTDPSNDESTDDERELVERAQGDIVRQLQREGGAEPRG